MRHITYGREFIRQKKDTTDRQVLARNTRHEFYSWMIRSGRGSRTLCEKGPPESRFHIADVDAGAGMTDGRADDCGIRLIVHIHHGRPSLRWEAARGWRLGRRGCCLIVAACGTRTMPFRQVPNQGRPRHSQILGFFMPLSALRSHLGSFPVGLWCHAAQPVENRLA